MHHCCRINMDGKMGARHSSAWHLRWRLPIAAATGSSRRRATAFWPNLPWKRATWNSHAATPRERRMRPYSVRGGVGSVVAALTAHR